MTMGMRMTSRRHDCGMMENEDMRETEGAIAHCGELTKN